MSVIKSTKIGNKIRPQDLSDLAKWLYNMEYWQLNGVRLTQKALHELTHLRKGYALYKKLLKDNKIKITKEIQEWEDDYR